MLKVRDEYHFDDLIEDGRTLRVPLMLCDSVTPQFAFDAADHQPGFRGGVTDAAQDARLQDARTAARDARDLMIRRATEAWRAPHRDAAGTQGSAEELAMRRHLGGPGSDNPDDDAQKRRDAAYQGYASELANAWRRPFGVTPAQPALAGPGPASFLAAAASTDPAVRARQIEAEAERSWRERGGR